MGYKIRRSRIEVVSVLIQLMIGSKTPEVLAYLLLEPGDEVIALLLLFDTREGHLGTGNVLRGGVHDWSEHGKSRIPS